ncbi:MAG: ATP-binding cassette domain-containing protein [Spirochaetales bacterium]|jgi:putative tryptophan/tyrosine transport system ATP-binding protein|nr:ATP-binding cassette domain-containing protein [Spirochaetales bacterium]
MIQLEHISKVFQAGMPTENTAIRDINLTVKDGDFITIIGSNGAGKTTLFNLITGTYPPTEGKVIIQDKDVTKQPEYKRARYIGRIFQDPLLGTASNMSLEDNMMITYKKGFKGLKISLNGKLREFFREKLEPLQMGLENRMKANVGLLSGGQRQALTLLTMVLSEPALILLDEHTAALDPKNADIVLGLTTRFIEEYRLTTMMITHNMSQAIKFGTRLLMMDAGEIILDVEGEEKKELTVDRLIEKFHAIRKKSFENDEALLSKD